MVGALGVALLLSLAGNGYLWLRVDNVKLQHKTFKAQVAANAEIAKVEIEKREFWNKENLRVANEKLKLLFAKHDADIKRVRADADRRAASRRLPEAPKESSRPDLMCLDREQFERGIRERINRLRERIRRIADRCTASSVKYQALCEWSKKIQ